MINYWDVGRIIILGIGMDKETRIIGNSKRYTWEKFVIVLKQ